METKIISSGLPAVALAWVRCSRPRGHAKQRLISHAVYVCGAHKHFHYLEPSGRFKTCPRGRKHGTLDQSRGFTQGGSAKMQPLKPPPVLWGWLVWEKLHGIYASWAREMVVGSNTMIAEHVAGAAQARLTLLANPYNLRDGKGLRARLSCGGVYK